MNNYDLIIIGAGAGGLSAAISAHQSGTSSILLIERNNRLGGILNQCIHSGFGTIVFNEQLTGPEYAQRLINEVQQNNIDYLLNTDVMKIDKNKKVYCASKEKGFQVYTAKAIIITAGSYERSAGAIKLPGDRPAGILTAGQAQAALNIDGYLVGKRIFILGSGDIGMIMARRMHLEGAKVLGVAEILPYPSGLPRNRVQCLEDFNIPLYLSHTVVNAKGKDRLESIRIAKVDEFQNPIEGTEIDFDVDTLLLSVGLISNDNLLVDVGIDRGYKRMPDVDQNFMSKIPGIFIAGNGLHVHDLVDFVTEEAYIAGKVATDYIFGELKDYANARVGTEAGHLINYVMPGLINLDKETKLVKLKYRVSKPMNNVRFVIRQNEHIIKKFLLPFATPAVMESVNIFINKILPNQPIIMEVKEYESAT